MKNAFNMKQNIFPGSLERMDTKRKKLTRLLIKLVEEKKTGKEMSIRKDPGSHYPKAQQTKFQRC